MIRINLFIYFIALLLLSSESYADLFDDGTSFLLSTQQTDGSWSSTETRPLHTTPEVLRTLQVVGVTAAARNAAANFLDVASTQDTDTLARRIDALVAEGRDVTAAVDDLVAAADPRGGWGLTSGFSADPLDTALALTALASAGSIDVHQLFSSLSFLVANQHPDGGWGCVRGGPSDVSCTAQVLLAFHAHYAQLSLNATFAAIRARFFLLAALHPDGSIGGNAANPLYTTALAARALVASENELGTHRPAVVAYLENQQSPNGSWGGDPLLTAVVLHALHSLINVPVCGDGIINRPTETCDGIDLSGQTCQSLGFDSGTLSCRVTCAFDTRQCTSVSTPPVIISRPVTTVAEGQLYSYDVETADMPSFKMYWADPGTDLGAGVTPKIQRANLDGSEVEDLIFYSGLQFPLPLVITLDPTRGKMYWTDLFQIQRANLDGSARELVTEENAFLGLAIDSMESKVYWAENTRIRRANLDGSNVETLIGADIILAGMALDLDSRKMYWVRRRSVGAGSTGEIKRANLDGSNIELLLTGAGDPISIALDLAGGKMYWANEIPANIQRANLDGSNVETLVTGTARFRGIALDLAQGKMYWTRGLRDGRIQRANLDGSQVEDLVAGLGQPIGIALLSSPLRFSLDVAPAGMTIDAETGLIQWTPDSSQVDDHAITVRVEDVQGLFATQNFIVTVLPEIHVPLDNDGDGFPDDVDCDDTNPNVHPGGTEVLGNGIDDDCNPGTTDTVAPGAITCTVTTDKLAYGVQEAINTEVVLQWMGDVGSLAGLQLTVQALQESGALLGEVVEPVAPLGAEERRQRKVFFSTGTTPPGMVSVSVQVLSNVGVVTSCATATTIVSSAETGVSLFGSLSADPPVAFVDEAIVLRYAVTNVGNVPLQPANFKLLVVNTTTGSMAAMLFNTAPLPLGAIFATSQTLPPGITSGDYLGILQGGADTILQTLASTPLKLNARPNRLPVARCQDVTIPTDAGVCTAASASVDNGSTDPDGDPLTLTQVPDGPYNLGSTPVTLTATDDKGASASCTATVTVVDQQPPTLTCPADLTAEATGPQGAAVPFAVTATDNCSVPPTTSCTPSVGSTFSLGGTPVSCTATDGATNQRTCGFTVTVVDTTKPTSQVLSLAATQNTTSFLVEWAGTDEGSGIKDYTIFVAENNAPFAVWRSNTSDTTGIFTGQDGKTYAFYSVARDQIHNIEDAPTVPDTLTQVLLTIPCDLNGDRIVDCADLALVKASFGKRNGQPGFDPRADTNSDGIVNVRDLACVAQKLPVGTRCP